MVTSDLFYDAWRNVLRHYVRGIRMVEALMRRYGFGRLRLLERNDLASLAAGMYWLPFGSAIHGPR